MSERIERLKKRVEDVFNFILDPFAYDLNRVRKADNDDKQILLEVLAILSEFDKPVEGKWTFEYINKNGDRHAIIRQDGVELISVLATYGYYSIRDLLAVMIPPLNTLSKERSTLKESLERSAELSTDLSIEVDKLKEWEKITKAELISQQQRIKRLTSDYYKVTQSLNAEVEKLKRCASR